MRESCACCRVMGKVGLLRSEREDAHQEEKVAMAGRDDEEVIEVKCEADVAMVEVEDD